MTVIKAVFIGRFQINFFCEFSDFLNGSNVIVTEING